MLDEAFWRVVGLYLAEGNTYTASRWYLMHWSFHPTKEEHLVDEVVGVLAATGRGVTRVPDADV